MNNLPASYPPLSPVIAVKNADQAIAFYKSAFGAVELYRLIDPETKQIGHAEITINGCLIMLSDEYPAHNKTPETLSGTTVKICLMIEDVDAMVKQFKAAGGTVFREPKDQFYGHRCACVVDPFGHEWMISHEIEKVTPAEMQRRWDSMVKS